MPLLFMSTGITCRRGVYSFRARVPTHLAEAYGRAMVSVSLGTRDPEQAKRLARARQTDLARRFQQAELEVNEAILQRRKEVAVPIPLVATDKLSLDDVFKHWKRQKGTNPKTVRSFEQAFELFKAHCLAPTAAMVKKADVVAFRDAMTDRGQISAATLAIQPGHTSLSR